MKKPIVNLAASVHDRLIDRAGKTKRAFNELLQYYAMERFLYRLSKSEHSDKFILKGALMFTAWDVQRARATVDIDFLARTENTVENLVSIARAVCANPVEPDGMEFSGDISGEKIKVDAEYSGVRLSFFGYLGTARVPMQIDIGFGDKVTPRPSMIEYPVILNMPTPRLRGYTRETVVAEKFHAMIERGQDNSRMKDFYDVSLLCQQFDFESDGLAKAIEATFKQRGTEFSPKPIAFTKEFALEAKKKAQWAALVRKVPAAPADFELVIQKISEFLHPVIETIVAGKPRKMRWEAPGPWK